MTTAKPRCDVCDESFPSMDHYVDHLADDHDAFTLLAGGAGR